MKRTKETVYTAVYIFITTFFERTESLEDKTLYGRNTVLNELYLNDSLPDNLYTQDFVLGKF